jgi:hypothetical protein
VKEEVLIRELQGKELVLKDRLSENERSERENQDEPEIMPAGIHSTSTPFSYWDLVKL